MHEKVRIAELIDIQQLNQRSLGTYALQAHLDFALIEEKQELIAAILRFHCSCANVSFLFRNYHQTNRLRPGDDVAGNAVP
ncbi:hypothetical protein M3P21_11335 [Ruegeria sp. 2012CJ41-6]|uniref:Uncharacterized protein n=1 Tax=Ruegeria spongiae TaxID=2942209 RepID=A0ABT0Q2U6_9RHOB|nr:hypothetical protein [Ruegeria spongiae]MCL6284122.1 hypothetical protein [Ruegeria spongiae]